jgi:hypothetical protein
MLDRLSRAITDAGIPLERVEGKIGAAVLVFQSRATQQQINNANTIKDNFDWSVATDTAWRAAIQRTLDSNALEGSVTTEVRVLRALVAVLIDEVNILRQWTRDLKTQTAAASNLANFQSRVATLPTLADRTATQARTAISGKISNGDVES